MRSCLRVPRVLIPRKGFEKWAVVARDAFPRDRAYWESVVREVGEAPSALGCILSEAFSEDAEGDVYERLWEQMYLALESGYLEKLNRGFILTVRKTPSGVRKGILASVDLEEFSCIRGESATVHASQGFDSEVAERERALRRLAPLEFPHAVLFYRDKRDKIVRGLEAENLEEIYDFELMQGGGHLTGYFIPDYIALDVAHELRSRGEPNFAVADGEESLAAAKAHWEDLKSALSEEEQRNHPARFALVELVNLSSDGVELLPVHRLLEDVDAEAFCDYFTKNIPCKRKGNVLYPKNADSPDGVTKIDETIARFVRANAGIVRYIDREEELTRRAAGEGCAGVALSALDKEDLFPALKGGKTFPRRTFALSGAAEKRYYLEGREISYD